MSTHRHRAAALLLIALGAGCTPSPRAVDVVPPTVTPAAASADVHGRPLATVDAFAGPEAVRYDPDQDVYFVANFGSGESGARDNNGFISRMRPDGSIEHLRFIAGGANGVTLHAPRGMAITGDTLWVADNDALRGYHRRTGAPLATVDVTALAAGFLNDVASGADGALYVTDTPRNRIYRITGRTASVALDDSTLGRPNGIAWDASNARFIVVPYGGGHSLFAWTPGGALAPVATSPGSRFDGVEVLGRDTILVASQTDTTLHLFVGGTGRPVIRTSGRPADIAVDTRRARVAVPFIALNRVEIWALPRLAGTASTADGRAPVDTATVAFTNVSVIPMDSERVLAGQTVIVRGDRIVSVGSAASARVPAGATRIDGAGQFLLPGLAEMHGHVPPPNAPAAAVENTLFLYLAGGITTVRGMLGAPGQLELRERVRRGQALGPTLYLAGPSFNGNSVNSPADAERMVRQQKLEGWDLLKVHPGLTRDEYDAMARTAREVGIRFGGHVPADVGLRRAIEMGQETFDHIDGYIELLKGDGPMDPTAVADIVRRTRAANAWVVPTSALWETLLGVTPLETLTAMPELKYMPPQTVRSWTAAHENRLRNPQPLPEAARTIARNRVALLKALHAGGVQILMGTDAPQQFSVPGFSIHHELRKMAESGMTPYEILVTGTRNVGRYFAGSDRFGIIAPGNRADMLLLKANPLRDLRNLERRSGVMVRGRWLPESEIQAGLARIAAGYSGG